jgi:tRNA dimethylallyltransferase
MDTTNSQPLVVICGPTASGKSEIAMHLARQKNGEIICADSRTIYKYMDIGTAKPSLQDQREVPHHLIDIVEPGQRFTVVDFKSRALDVIADMRKRGKLPILVGGTGLYIDSIIYDYQFESEFSVEQRSQFESMTLAHLHVYCKKHTIELSENRMNKRHVINAILRGGSQSTALEEPIGNTILVAVKTDKELLRARIKDRAEHIFSSGVVEEAKKLGKMYGWDNEAMTGNIYPLVHQYLEGNLTLKQIKEQFITLDWRLAKRQLTWLRRNKHLIWIEQKDVLKYAFNRLEKNEQK